MSYFTGYLGCFIDHLFALSLSCTFTQAKGSDAATTTGTEAAVYASEASDNNDLLDGILPVTVSDYVDLVKAHLSAGLANFLVV